MPGVEVVEAGAEALPLPNDAFDATLSQLVVNFLEDAPRGLAEMRRVTRPGGVVAGCTWDYAGEMTMLRAFWDAARSLDQNAADEGVTMRYADPESLGELWRGAGLADVAVSPIVAEAAYDDFDDLWEPFLAGNGPAGAHGGCSMAGRDGTPATGVALLLLALTLFARRRASYSSGRCRASVDSSSLSQSRSR